MSVNPWELGRSIPQNGIWSKNTASLRGQAFAADGTVRDLETGEVVEEGLGDRAGVPLSGLCRHSI